MINIKRDDFQDLIHLLKERNFIDKNEFDNDIEAYLVLDGVNII